MQLRCPSFSERVKDRSCYCLTHVEVKEACCIAGEALYVGERERILSPSHAKATRRRALNAARRDKQLALAYSLSLAASFAILVAEAQGVNIRLPLS